MAYWDDARRSEAFAILIDGKSAFEAAKLLNTRYRCRDYTRNSIIGQVSRHGTAEVRSVMRSRCGPSRTNRTTKIVRNAVRKPPQKPAQSKLAEFLAANAKPLPSPSETDVARVSFNDLDPKLHCRFVPADPSDGFSLTKPLYCGISPVLGTAYCEAHLRRCHNPPELKLRIVARSRPMEAVNA